MRTKTVAIKPTSTTLIHVFHHSRRDARPVKRSFKSSPSLPDAVLHSFPFREGLKDKVYNGHICRYAEGNYACFFGWPNLTHTPIGGFLGLPGNDCRVDMRVVDVYRRQDGKLAENWVIIDLPWWLKQQGIDILERCKNITS